MFSLTRNIRSLCRLMAVFLLFAFMGASAHSSEREHFISLLESASDLNNSLKLSIKNKSGDYLGVRNQLEIHLEKELLPCLPFMVEFILKNQDYKLYADLLRFLVSASNIADESIYSAAEKIFTQDRALLMQAAEILEQQVIDDLHKLYGMDVRRSK